MYDIKSMNFLKRERGNFVTEIEKLITVTTRDKASLNVTK